MRKVYTSNCFALRFEILERSGKGKKWFVFHFFVLRWRFSTSVRSYGGNAQQRFLTMNQAEKMKSFLLYIFDSFVRKI